MDKKELRKEIYAQIIPNLIWERPLNRQQEINFKIWKKEFNIDLDYLRWYTDKRILFQIVKYLGNKELCLNSEKSMIRWLYASKIEHLLKYFYVYEFFEKPKTLYCGLAGFKYREQPPISPILKRKWQEEVWTGGECKYLTQMNSYDFGMDFDSDNWKDSWKDCKKVVELFERFKIRYSVWFSGKKGFHIKVPYNEIKDLLGNFDVENIISFCKSLALDLRDFLKLKNIDLIIYSSSRYLKCCFSLDSRNKNPIYPLSLKEFKNFKKLKIDMEYCLNNKNIGFMDVYHGRISNPEGFKKMVEYL